MRGARDIQRPKPASAPEKGRGPQCGKDRRSATVCPCRHVPTWHGIPAKVFQVSLPSAHLPRFPCESVPGVLSRLHLARYPCESVPGVLFRLPPGTEIPRKRVRCLSPLPTCHGIPAKVFQVSFSASHLARYPCESVPGVLFRLPPGTEIPQKRVRCLIPPLTWHGNPAKACQVSHPASQACQVSHPASHLARKSRKSVSGVSSRLSPGTEFPRKCVRCLIRLPPGTVFLRKCSRSPFLPSTCHGGSSHHGMLGFFSRAYGCFQHEACNHQHTCSCGIHASF